MENILGVIIDITNEFKVLWGADATAEKKAAVYKKLVYHFNNFKDFVGAKPFALGYVTLVDFILSERVYYFEQAFTDLKKDYPFLFRIRHNFEQLPEIKDYYSRPDAVL